MYVFFVLFISVYSCVYLAPAGSPQALCAPASVLLWLPGAPEDFFAGICWQINAAGLANCSFSGWHQPQRTLNTKLWPWTLFSLFVSHKCAHTNNKTSLRKTKNFIWAQFEEKSQNPALNLDQNPNPQLWGIRSDLLQGLAIGHYSIPHCPLSLSFSLFLSLCLAVTPVLPFFSLTNSLSQIWDSCFTLWKGGKVALILPIMPQSLHLLCRSD